MLASVGAKYSRSNEGLESILASIGDNQEAAIDRIFRHVDFGHRSIADISPVSIFLDQISMYMALKIWNLCPTAGGQESSTRYIKISRDSVYERGPDTDKLFDAYDQSYQLYLEASEIDTSLIGIDRLDPEDLKTKRLIRNYAFDRSRYYLPMSCLTNMMMVMSARGWVDLCKYLMSDIYTESRELACKILSELNKVVPRLVKHGGFDSNYSDGIYYEFEQQVAAFHNVDDISANSPAGPSLHILDPNKIDINGDLKFHNNRYGFIGRNIKKISVRYGWEALTIAELRDLNRHRTGVRIFDLTLVGTYFADDQIEILTTHDNDKIRSIGNKLLDLRNEKWLKDVCNGCLESLQANNQEFVYQLPMGTQTKFTHTTTANFLLYTIQLRTGLGSHYLYSMRMKEIFKLWNDVYPETENYIKAGMAEPE